MDDDIYEFYKCSECGILINIDDDNYSYSRYTNSYQCEQCSDYDDTDSE